LGNEFLIFHRFNRAETTRHADERALLDLCEAAHTWIDDSAVRFDVAACGRRQNTLSTWEAPEDFIGSREIELRDTRVNRKHYNEVCGHRDLRCSDA